MMHILEVNPQFVRAADLFTRQSQRGSNTSKRSNANDVNMRRDATMRL